MSAPMHIGLVAIGGAGWMGGAEYIRNLVSAIRAADPEARVSVLCRQDDAAHWQDVAPTILLPSWPSRSPLARKLGFGNRAFARAIKQAGVDFVYPLTYDNEHNIGVKLPLRKSLGSCSYAGWVPDFQHRYLPHLFSPEDLARRDQQIARLVADAPRVVFSSEHAASDFRRFYPEHADKARVLTFATFPKADWSEPYTDAELNELPQKFFVVCNQFWQHKNHLVLFRALEILRLRGDAPVVICTGELKDYRNPDYSRQILEHLEPLQRSGIVRMLGLIPRRRQIEIIRRALAVIQPSLFEGWSTVVEDTRVLGRPCFLSDFPVHREQNPPGARFFPPDSPEILADLLSQAWQTLEPGPDLVSEAAALKRAQDRIVEVGRTFLGVANEGRSRVEPQPK